MKRYEFGAVSDRGLSPRRPINEDRYLVLPENGLFAVADGVGGEQAGEIASQTVIDTLAEAVRAVRADEDLEEYLDEALQLANNKIYLAARSDSGMTGMASTVALAWVNENHAIIAHVGDSRVYTLRHGRLRRETHDHTDSEDARRRGQRIEAGGRHNNVINRAVGAEQELDAEFSIIKLRDVEAMLLCTDGVTRHINDDELKEILSSNMSAQQMCDEVKALCHRRGAEDNLTAVVVKMALQNEERTLPPARHKRHQRNGNGSRIEVDVLASPQLTAKSGYQQEQKSRSVLGAALKMLLIVSMIAGAFYAGMYVAKHYLSPPRAQSLAATGGDALEAQLRSTSDAGLKEALQFFDSREFMASRGRLQQLSGQAPQNPYYHYWLARANFELGYYQAALPEFQQAIDLKLTAPPLFLYQALSYQALGMDREAAASFKRFAQERMKK